jgi:hypothetical protein
MRRALLALVAALATAGGAHATPRIVSLDQCADQYVLALAPRDEIVGHHRGHQLGWRYPVARSAGGARRDRGADR